MELVSKYTGYCKNGWSGYDVYPKDSKQLFDKIPERHKIEDLALNYAGYLIRFINVHSEGEKLYILFPQGKTSNERNLVLSELAKICTFKQRA